MSSRRCLSACLLLAAAILSCGGGTAEDPSRGQPVLPDTIGGVPADTVVKWLEHAESPYGGMGAPENGTFYALDRRLGGEELNPAFYDPYDFCAQGDTLFVADQSTCQVVAITVDGDVLWRAGGQGEGPGHFSRMGGIAASEEHVCALNPILGRAELFGRDGAFLRSVEISLPHDVEAVSSGRFVVASRRQPGGHLHVLDPDSGLVRSFGEAVVDEAYENVGMMDMLKLAVGPGDTLALFNRYQGSLALYDYRGQTCVYRGSRQYPARPESPRMEQSGDMMQFYMFPVAVNVFFGSAEELNSVVKYQADGSFLSEMGGEGQPPVTVIDRYSWSGEYLGSFCLPESSAGATEAISGGRLVSHNYHLGTLDIYLPLEL